jgi:hypothetical protein
VCSGGTTYNGTLDDLFKQPGMDADENGRNRTIEQGTAGIFAGDRIVPLAGESTAGGPVV